MARILIGFVEALAAPETIFSLRAAGHEVRAFARGAAAGPVGRLLDGPLSVLPDPSADAEAAVRVLRDLIDGPEAPDAVLPLDDDSLWLVDAALGGDVRNAGAHGAQARNALDKERQLDAARAAGLAVPETVIVREAADLDGVGRFPAIAKPALAVELREGRLAKGDATYLSGAADLDALRGVLAARDEASGPLLVQPLVAGTGEGVFGHATSEGVIGWSGHRRVRMMNPHGSGASCCISVIPDPALCDRVQAFLDAIGWRGPFMVELLRDGDGTPWFMELNGRMWGSLALARRQGFEYPAWAVGAALDPAFRPAPPPAAARPVTQRHIGRDLLHLLFVLRGPQSDFHRQGWPRLGQSLAAVLRPAPLRSFYNYDPAHPLYPLRDAAWTIRKTLGRRR